LLLSSAREQGLKYCRGAISSLDSAGGSGFRLEVRSATGLETIDADQIVLAAGPFINELAGMLGINLPVEHFLQRKIVIPDPLELIPREMPFTIFSDPQQLDWSEQERELIATDPEYGWLLNEFPPGLHIKPESKDQVKLGWAFNRRAEKPRWAHEDDVDFPNIVIRGASRFIPALKSYVDDLPTPVVQMAGYYSRTPENWPLIGPLGIEGAYVIAALSGFGTMAGCAAGELCADWMAQASLAEYHRHFHPDRYSDPEIMAEIAGIESDGQL
jgi:glycine/D-amino acid oxidase-like deaminating enzyme